MTGRALRVVLLGLLLAGAGLVATVERAPSPVVSVSPEWATSGTETVVIGSNFPTRRRGVVIVGQERRIPVGTDGHGGLHLSVTVPSGRKEVHITAKVGKSAAAARLGISAPASVRFGVSTPGHAKDLAELDAFERSAGKRVSLVTFYQGLVYDRFERGPLDAIVGRGALPMLTLEPYDHRRGVDQSEYRLGRIIQGSYDGHIRSWAEGLKQWGKPLLVRFAHEMNGDWYPWAEAANGNRPGEYVLAWRHVHDLFVEVGATNVAWVWSPNVAFPGSTPIRKLYPGDAYVDWVGLDGYNWGTAKEGSRWTRFDNLFGPSLREVRLMAESKPVMIAEVASAEEGGSKATWISDFFGSLPRHPEIAAFVWFDHEKEADWRIASSDSARSAFARGVADPRYF